MNSPKRNIFIFENHFWEFYNSQNLRVQKKIDWVIELVRSLPVVPKKYFEHMSGTDGLFEMRIQVGSNIYRVFCCFDKGNLVVLFSGFQKKTQKTPRKEIQKAIRLMKQYHERNRK